MTVEMQENPEEQAEEIAHLKAADGEVLFALRGKRIESVVYAALDHERLADHIQAEWSECIGLHEPHKRSLLGGKGESVAEIAVALLKDYKKLLLDHQVFLAEASHAGAVLKGQVDA